jgi:hypothetical protein
MQTDDLPIGCIADLAQQVERLAPEEQELFHRLFHVSTTVGTLDPPETMRPWIERLFGSVEAVKQQRIIKVTNLVTWEGALFNELRANRPMEATASADLERLILENIGDPFCKPLEGTPADSFGRVKGTRSITASNIAKYDGFHGVVIFDEHNPLAFTRESVADAIDTALAWAREAHAADAEAKYFFWMWNCLWKSGASIIHGHAQMTLSREMHYAKVEGLRRAALAYRAQHGSSYFDDLYRVHEVLGLAFQVAGVKVIAYLAPIKEKEVVLISNQLDMPLKHVIYEVLACFVHQLGVTSFNLALYVPPIVPDGEDWSGFPAMVRLVDRGDPNNKTADFGAMELYAASVIASDPFAVAKVLRAGIPER